MATGLISGLADIDAININMSKLSESQISSSMAAIVILLAIVSNTIVKIILSFIKGSKSLRYSVLAGLALTILLALLSILVIYYKVLL